jgi:RNA polymerase sigma-70 factor (ECF subfamily)
VAIDDMELPSADRSIDSRSAERSLDADTVLEALGQLDERFRAPLALFYLEGHSYQEIADILEVPIGTIMSRLRRGKDHMRAHLEKAPAEQPRNNIHPFRKEASQ